MRVTDERYSRSGGPKMHVEVYPGNTRYIALTVTAGHVPPLLTREDAQWLIEALQRALGTGGESQDDALKIPVKPVSKPCEECRSTDYPNLQYSLVGISGVLCRKHLEEVIAQAQHALDAASKENELTRDQALTLMSLIKRQSRLSDVQVRQIGNFEFVVVVNSHVFVWDIASWNEVKEQFKP